MEVFMEEKKSQMIPPSGAGKPCFRIAHFLKPSCSSSQQQKLNNFNTPSPPISSPSNPISNISKTLSSKVDFHGWKNPLKSWTPWVDELLPKFQSTWKKSSIYEAIMASKFEIPRCRDSVFSITEKWCPKTNTFVFSWGEATLTLEDVLVLGGYSVTGTSVSVEISSSNLKIIKRNLENVYSELNNSKAKKVSHYQWVEFWRKNGREFEHEAFLSFWLSRYVFPASSCGVINKNVFSIAILLARGTRIALAPAVLASIYNDLRVLNKMISGLRLLRDQDDDDDDKSTSKISLGSPMQLLQTWIWERFTALSPKPNSLTDGSPRLQRWHKVEIPKNDDVGLCFDSEVERFIWRPYTSQLNNWSSSRIANSIYVEEACWVSVNPKGCLDLESYVRIVRNSMLVGLCCFEQYLPHRVSMQFGLDQDIPCDFPRVNGIRKMAWDDYNKSIGDVKVYIPSRLFESDVTTSYLEWWKKSEFVNENANWERKQESMKVSPSVISPKGKRVVTDYDSSDQHQPNCKRSRHSPCRPVNAIKSRESNDDDNESGETLTELFRTKGTKNASRSQDRESPLSCAGNNAFIQEIASAKDYTGNISPSVECAEEELVIEERSGSKIECQVRNPVSIKKNEVQTMSNGTPESSGMNILDRIARLQRLINMVKAEKMSQV